MSKRRYRSVEFNQVNWTGLAEEFGAGRAVLAVDVAKQDFVAAVLGPDAEVRVTFKWQHPGQTAELLGYLSRLAKTSALEAVLEPSGTYGDGLIWQLRQLGLVVYRVSPKRVHDVAEVYDGVPSLHDAKAAELIGRLHLQGVSQVWEARGEVSKARRQRQLNRLEAHLSRHWPEVLALLDLGSVTLGELVAAYGSPAAVAADLQGAQMLMCRVGRVGLSQETVAAVLASSGTSLGLPCVGAESGLLQWLAADSNVYPSFLAAISASSWRGTSGSSIGYRMKE